MAKANMQIISGLSARVFHEYCLSYGLLEMASLFAIVCAQINNSKIK